MRLTEHDYNTLLERLHRAMDAADGLAAAGHEADRRAIHHLTRYVLNCLNRDRPRRRRRAPGDAA